MKHRKVVVGSLFAFGVIIWYVVGQITRQVGSYFQIGRRLAAGEILLEFVPIVLAGGLFIFLLRHKKTTEFLDEVVAEMSKVSWPVRKELIASTIVAIVMMIISGVLLGFFDSIWTFLLKQIV